MPDDKKIEDEMKKLSERLRERDEAERKKAQKEFRAAMDKDTAGTVLNLFNITQAQYAGLQNQLDSVNPLAPLVRAVGELNVRVTAIEQALRGKAEEPNE